MNDGDAARITPRPSVRAFCLAAAAAAALGCGSGDEPIRIGLALGANLNTPSMQSVYRGVELAVAHLNEAAAGKRSFALRTAGAEMTSAVEIATTLRDDPTVVGVVGHTDSGGSLEAAPIYADVEQDGRRAVVAVSPTATSPLLSGYSAWFFRVCPSDVAASQAAARYVLDSLPARRAAIIYRNDAYGKEWSRAFASAFRDGGGTVVQRDPYATGMQEWPAYAGYIRKQRADIVLFPGSPRDAEALIQALRDAGGAPPLLGGDAVSELEGKPTEYRGNYFTAFFRASAPVSDEGRAFVEAFRRKFDAVPDQRAALAYDAAMVIGRAALAEGSDRRRVRDHIAKIGSRLPPLAGATGPIAFDRRNDVVDKPVVIARIGS